MNSIAILVFLALVSKVPEEWPKELKEESFPVGPRCYSFWPRFHHRVMRRVLETTRYCCWEDLSTNRRRNSTREFRGKGHRATW
ncbi:hypothetical protein GGS26DRAFT_77469 [Hypomontagnella submonticulosa]|nr:hypothetical protein GGS26DRAFT_77469 [Hypomontagnella submonticulosa]